MKMKTLALTIALLIVRGLTDSAEANIVLPNGNPDPNFGALQVWYDAGSIGVGDGNPVTSWTSSAATSNAATIGTASRQPTLVASGLNGLPAVAFDGIDDQLIMASNIFTGSGATRTYFSVIQTTDTSAHLIGVGSSAAGFLTTFGGGLIIDGTATVKANTNGSGVYLQSTTADYSDGRLITAVAANNASVIEIDALTENTDATNTVSPHPYARATLGASDGSASGNAADPFGGSISEILVYESLTPGEIGQVNDYLLGKYFNVATVPEPSAFLFGGLVTTICGVWSGVRSRRCRV